MKKPVAAVILAAGRGTRMKDNFHNKVCFDCAGIPVIRRVVQNMKNAGVDKIVVVVGHMAQDVMDALYGIKGIFYAYQKNQNGTGSAAMVGLKLLDEMGHEGPVIISVGDKIVGKSILCDFVNMTGSAVFGVQKTKPNQKGGMIAIRNGKPCGICEFADAAILKVWPKKKETWKDELTKLGLNETKINSVVRNVEETAVAKNWFIKDGNGAVNICGETFFADELLNSPYSNLSIYRFDLHEVIKALENCSAANVQGEIYLTDTMEYFARKNQAKLCVVENTDEVLTYSTKPELIEISRKFMRFASEMKETIDPRVKTLLNAFIEKYGDKKVAITSAPGRVNILGRHIDHRGGNTNVMAIDRNTLLAVSPRTDQIVNISNVDKNYPDYSFDISEFMALDKNSDWVSFIESDPVRKFIEKNCGAWFIYVMSAIARFQFSTDFPLCGMDIMVSGNIPVAAGLSSSSSIVVASAEAVTALNCLNISDSQFVDWCGEGEWLVGTRGGAGDHAAMKCSKVGHITQLGFKPFYIGKSEQFSNDYAIIIADSNIKSNKAVGNKDKYNEKVATYELSFMLMKKYFPEYDMVELRDAAKIRPYSNIYKMLKKLPEEATRDEIKSLLPEFSDKIDRIFASHKDPFTYNLRGVALFGISECARSLACLDYLKRNDYTGLGKLMKISHDGDRVIGKYPLKVTDEYLIKCAKENADISLQPGAYACSVKEIDELCDMLNGTEGVLGSQLLGAGLGGCIAILVKKPYTDSVLNKLKTQYYDKNGYPMSAAVYLPESGSSVTF